MNTETILQEIRKTSETLKAMAQQLAAYTAAIHPADDAGAVGTKFCGIGELKK